MSQCLSFSEDIISFVSSRITSSNVLYWLFRFHVKKKKSPASVEQEPFITLCGFHSLAHHQIGGQLSFTLTLRHLCCVLRCHFASVFIFIANRLCLVVVAGAQKLDACCFIWSQNENCNKLRVCEFIQSTFLRNVFTRMFVEARWGQFTTFFNIS